MATKYRDEIPATKTERLQPKFTVRGELAKSGPKGMPIHQTTQGNCFYSDEAGRRSRIGLSQRFIKG